MNFKRIFLIVLDSFGIGELPDAADYSDIGSNTLRAVYSGSKLNLPNLKKLGLFNIDGVRVDEPEKHPSGAFGRSSELSRGKDTTVGHWEIAGVISERPFPVFENGFPVHILQKLEEITGIGYLCNKPYSGTDVIRDYAELQREQKKMIIYTSADSVFQVAAHTDVFPLDVLYDYCTEARKLLTGEFAVGRVIARPFIGEYPDYVRTSDRHDYALEPPSQTMLDLLKEADLDVISVGKINDIFASRGITDSYKTRSNAEGMAMTTMISERDFSGLCFTNLVDFDSKYGHRNDPIGYAGALSEFDDWLGNFIKGLQDSDLLIITADHGCDPVTESTDHSREYVPVLAYCNGINSVNLGTRSTFSDIAKTICENFNLDNGYEGESILKAIFRDPPEHLLNEAIKAQMTSFAPYSSFNVGASILCSDGSVVSASNVESAAFSPTSCAERSALVKAMSERKKGFRAIAVVGGVDNKTEVGVTPCGVCRQMLYELGGKDMLVITLNKMGQPIIRRIEELLPDGFSGKSFGK